MEVFMWTPKSGESVADFNARLVAYCTASAVLDVTPSIVGEAIVLSLTELIDIGGDEAEPAGATCIIPQIFVLTTEQLECAGGRHPEKVIEEALAEMSQNDSEDNPFTPFKTTIHPTVTGALCLVLINGGEIDTEDDAELPGRPDPEDGTGALPPRRGR